MFTYSVAAGPGPWLEVRKNEMSNIYSFSEKIIEFNGSQIQKKLDQPEGGNFPIPLLISLSRLEDFGLETGENHIRLLWQDYEPFLETFKLRYGTWFSSKLEANNETNIEGKL